MRRWQRVGERSKQFKYMTFTAKDAFAYAVALHSDYGRNFVYFRLL